MLVKWRELVIGTDPDIITGYNCINFDLNYLMVRAEVLKLDEFKQLCKRLPKPFPTQTIKIAFCIDVQLYVFIYVCPMRSALYLFQS